MRRTPSFESFAARALHVSREGMRSGFRKVGDADFDAVLALRQRCLGERIRWDDAAYLRWRYQIGPDAHPAAGELWGLQVHDRLVGIVGREWLDVSLNGERKRGQRAMDLLVDPAFANTPVGVWLAQVHFGSSDFELAVGANDQSIKIAKQLYNELPARTSYVFPLDFRVMLRRRGLRPWQANGLGAALNLVEPVLHPRLHARRFSVRRIERFTDELLASIHRDQEWRTRLTDSLEILHDSNSLNWRLFQNPRAHYKALGVFDDGICLGYIAFRVVLGPLSSKVLHLMEWQTTGDPSPDARVLRNLLSETLRYARRKGCSAMQTTVAHPRTEQLLRRLGFMPGKQAPYLYMGVRSTDKQVRRVFVRNDVWRVTDFNFDSDGCY